MPTNELSEAAEVVEVSDIPASFYFALWVPVFAVVLWFMVRIFSGRWITDPVQPLLPVGLDGDPIEDGAEIDVDEDV